MHRVWCDKKAMHDKHKHAKRVTQSERTRCRDEKYAGRGGPPDCEEVQAEGEGEAEVDENVSESAGECEREESVGGWDIVGGEEHLHSPRSCPPPCTSRTLARCTVS
jgi:hypothetical protein